MRILITGAGGFIGSALRQHFAEYNSPHEILALSRHELDLLDEKAVELALKDIDVVIHTAIKGGRRTKPDNYDVYDDNIQMYWNIHNAIRSTYNAKTILINISSGAEFNRSQDIYGVKEDQLSKAPFLNLLSSTDYYGLSKNWIAKNVLNTEDYLAYNLRIFNCFGATEDNTRFIHNVLMNPNLEIENDRFMDFFYIRDLYTVISRIVDLKHTIPFKDINCVYPIKTRLSEIAAMVRGRETFKVLSQSPLNYCGDGARLRSLDLPLLGLWRGIGETRMLLRQMGLKPLFPSPS